ncbi:hypothetical protein NEF87_004607 [Candidatus Lokiarchaeum ossiferum]|uniref:Transmembrane protein n=1 Tax=Candidatus Lokiarchaeum ossiferum TaxID=2951803 RepID=A0ABY6I172_9ARCH|nr:hypothetical protein NEF87_004607 [Candidatus Lokiarchaeum sp. B-35]
MKSKKYILLILLSTCLISTLNSSNALLFGINEGDVLIYEIREDKQMSYCRYQILSIDSTNISVEMSIYEFKTQKFINSTKVIQNLIYDQAYLATLDEENIISKNYGGKTVNCVEIQPLNASYVQFVDVLTGVVCEEKYSDLISPDFKKLISWDDLNLISLHESYKTHFFWGYFVSIVGFISLIGVLITVFLMRKMNGKFNHD